MRKIILIFGLLLVTNYTIAQCQKGDCKNGFSIMKYSDATYEGNYAEGKFDGLGLMFYNDKRLYHGEYKDNTFNGYGYYKWKTGETYIGSWKNGLQSGLGIQKKVNGGIQSAGLWADGKISNSLSSTSPTNNPKNCTGNCIEGIGQLIDKDSIYFTGIFKDKNIILGNIQSKDYLYDGEIKNNIPNGYGQIKYLNNNEYFLGYFKDGKKNGAGIFTDKSNKRVFGKWIDDVYQDPLKFEFSQTDFCKEIIALAKLNKKERRELVKGKNSSSITLEKHFLNQFNLKTDSYADNFTGNEKIHFFFPDKKEGKPTLVYEELIEACNSCKKLIPTKDSRYKYNDVELYVSKYSSGMTLTFPKPDPCISGNRKNGKGKKQYTDAIYEGEFKNGERSGKGKYAWSNGNSYDGEYKNDKRNGKGLFLWKIGDKYDGESVDDFRTGKGKYTWASGDSYEGDFVKNKTEGFGTHIWESGNKYVGEYKNSKRNGQGTFTYAKGSKYIGEYKDNKFHGFGKEYDENGLLFYEGNYINNMFEGLGTYYYKNESKYIGNWKKDKRNGFGKIYYKNTELKYEGDFENGKINGKGVSYDIDGVKFHDGNYKNGQRQGQGTYYYKDGKKAYEGNFENGKKNGQGAKYYTDGKYIGEFKDDLRQGLGKFYNLEGKLTFEGMYKDDKAVK
ncbi:MAG: hypothetical protein COA67_06725 [Lutibacter sp.]|nr:MAG: hypothetical protein COA67_06725 [Lutibacter sp.]